MKCKKINLIIILLSVIGLLGYILWSEGPSNLLHILTLVKPGWILCALALMVLYWVLEGVILHLLVLRFNPGHRFRDTFHTTMIGQFFNCVTPFASGGQPMQAVHLVKTGVPLGKSGCALLVKFIVYQTTLTIYSIVILCFQWRFFAQKISGFSYLVLVGFLINCGVMLGLLCICFFKKFTLWAATGIVRLLAKIRVVKKKEERMEYIRKELDQFYESFAIMKQNKGLIIQMILLSVVQLTAYFSITYFLHLSLESKPGDYLLILTAQAFVLMISSFVPLPGAAGGAEVSFYTFYQMFFSAGTLSVAMLFWRLITFYLPILVGVFYVVPIRSRKKKDLLKNLDSDLVPAESSCPQS